MEREPPDPAAEAARRVEFALQTQAAERAQRRRKLIIIAGSLANFISPLVGAFAAGMLSDFFKMEGLAIAAFAAIPAGIGASVAYFGMTMTSTHADVLEWGFGIPSRCFWYGMAPYALLGVLMPFFIIGIFFGAVLGWILAIAGGGITAFVIDRWFYRED